MSLVSLFTQRKREIGGILIDAVLSEMENNIVTVTSSPIENGANINDHAILQPRLYRLEGVVSDSERGSLSGSTDNSILQNSVNNLVDDLSGNVFNPFPTSGRSKTAYELLLSLQAEREPFTIQTGLSTIPGVIVTNITTNKDKSTGKALHFSAELIQLRIVNNQQTSIQSKNLKEGDARQQASPERKKGRLAVKQTTLEKEQAVNNILNAMGIK